MIELLYSEKPLVMGILNTTPDSFYDGGRHQTEQNILQRATQILTEGGDIIDVGGYSSRPYALEVSLEEELQRVIPAIKLILKTYPNAVISVDTFRAIVAQEAVWAGAKLVNDISGGELDAKMFETVAKLGVPYILMHNKGTPQTMQSLTDYDDIVKEIKYYFAKKSTELLALGVKDIILDLGFGFAKTLQQNYFLLKYLQVFQTLNLPILVGVSRKSMVYKALNINALGALNGSTVLHTIALLKNAKILRVHDIREARETITLLELMK